MIIAIGKDTGKLYAKGNNRKEVFRYLDKQYKYSTRRDNENNYDGYVYPEPLLIRRVE
ncbi:hypothetical protein ACFOZ1_06655 [Gracilibacillus marinus]|uniref:Uncharacterized protein n=1 Tax=Gracilibacillus marinus TaxID=630535 RepID=A0ABV8VUA4_9BACI